MFDIDARSPTPSDRRLDLDEHDPSMSIYRELAYDRVVSGIKGIQFCVLSEDDIRRRSVMEVKENQTYAGNDPVPDGLFDLRMGVVDGTRECATCHQRNTFCPGHFGHITMARPVFYVQFFDVVRKLLKCVCFRCSRIVIDLEGPEVRKILSKKMSRAKRWDLMSKMCTKVRRCGQDTLDGCGAKLPDKVVKTEDMKLKLVWKETASTAAAAAATGGGGGGGGVPQQKEVIFNAEDVLRVFSRMSDMDCEALGFSAEHNRPERMICTVLPVPPPSVRPSVRHETGQRQEDDLTHKLSEIIKANNMIRDRIARGASHDSIEAMHLPLLQYHVVTFVDNSMPSMYPSKDRAGRNFRSLTERLRHKEGRIRGNLMGKRVDFSARTVITPDPNLSIDELGVPLKIAMNLTFPEVVGPSNRDEMQRLVLAGPDVYPGAKQVRRTAEGNRTIRLRGHPDPASIVLVDGDIVERHLLNGDYVLFNRQPSLHKMSMMAHRVRVMPYNTFRLNVCVCASYNADFDGDEMNMHVPQSIQTHFELKELCAVPLHVLSPRYSRPIISIVQDVALGVFRITQPNVTVTQRQLFNLSCGNPLLGSRVTASTSTEKWTGRQVLSTVLPPTAQLRMKTESDPTRYNPDLHDVNIVDGIIQSGVLTEKAFSRASLGLVHSTYNTLGPAAVVAMLNSTQKLICDWLVLSGFSVGISDLIISDETVMQKRAKLEAGKIKVQELLRTVHTGTFENDSTKTDAELLEEKIGGILSPAVDEAVSLCRAGFHIGNNRMLNMIESGSKGKPFNFQQMTACLGAQSIEGRRVADGFDSRTLPHFTKYDDGPDARGFIEHSFIEGLSPHEFFFHSMAGRIGLIDTAVQTSQTGYLQRRLVKAMEDCKINHDLTVRNANNFIVQFLYGEDGMDAIKLEYQDLPTVKSEPAELRNEYLLVDPEGDLGAFSTEGVVAAGAADLDLWRSRCEDHFKQLVDDRRAVIMGLYKGLQEKPEIIYPVNIKRIVEMAAALHGRAEQPKASAASKKSDLDPMRVLDVIDQLVDELRIGGDAIRPVGVRWLPVLLRAHLSPKVLIRKHRLSSAAFERVVKDIRKDYWDAIAHPGEMVGIVAATSLGEPATQLSSSAESRVQISLGGKDGYDGPIGKFIDELMSKQPDRVIDLGGGSTVFDPVNDLYIVGVSNDEKTSWRRIQQVSRHPANGGMVRIHTMSGKTTCATLSHSFLRRSERGIVPVLGSDLKVGDRVPVASFVPPTLQLVTEVAVGNVNMALDRDFGWLCGTFVADGCLQPNQVKISKVIGEYQDELRRIFKEKFDLEMMQYYKKPGQGSSNVLHGWDMSRCDDDDVDGVDGVDGIDGIDGVCESKNQDPFSDIVNESCRYPGTENYVHSPPLSEFLLKSFNTGSMFKRLPPWIYSAPTEFVAGFLCGYFDGDGNVNDAIRHQMIRSASVSEKLTEDVILLLARVGIFASKCVERHIKEGDRKDLHTVQISRKHARAFKDRVGPMVVLKKAKALDNIIEYVDREDKHSSQEMIDKIPELGNVLASIGKTLELEGQSRLYGRYQKKEAIGRETLRSYIPTFEAGLEAKVARDEAMYVKRLRTLDDLREEVEAFKERPESKMKNGKFNPRSIVTVDVLQAVALMAMGTELLGAGKLCGSSNATGYRQTGRFQVTTLEAYLARLAPEVERRLAEDRRAAADVRDDKLPILRQAANSDVVWDEIVELEYLPDPTATTGEMVYDLTVPGNDSFMVDCGVLVHNTLNSVVHGTELMLRRVETETTTIIRETIGNLIDGRLDSHDVDKTPSRFEKHPNDTSLLWLKDGGDEGPIHSGLEVLSTDEDGRVSWKEVTAVTRHPVVNKDGTDTLIEVETESGRIVTATKGKSFLTRRNNKLVATEGEDLHVGDYLPVTRSLKLPSSDVIDFLELDHYLPRTEFLYQTELAKAIDLHDSHVYCWFHHGNGRDFVVPHGRGDSLMDCARSNAAAAPQRQFRPGCVYPKSQGARSRCHIPERLPLDELFGFYVGAYLAEGSEGNSQVGCVVGDGGGCDPDSMLESTECRMSFTFDDDQVHISNIDEDYQRRIVEFADRYDIGWHIADNSNFLGQSMDVCLHSKVLADLTIRMCGRRAENKRLPAELIAANEGFLKGVIDGYFSGDGTCSKKSYLVNAASASRGLVEDIANVLLRFDIGCKFATYQSKKERTAKGTLILPSHHINIRNGDVLRFANIFHLTKSAKESALDVMCDVCMQNPSHHTPEDVIPIIELPGSGTSITSVHRDSLPTLLASLSDPVDKAVVESAIGEDVWYDKVVSIKDVPNPTGRFVYDLTIRDTRTFALWNGMIQNDTFHSAGSAAFANVTQGVPRMKELLSMSKNIKTPSMLIRLRREWATSQEKTQAVLSTIEMTHFRDLVLKSSIHFDPAARGPQDPPTTIAADQGMMDFYKEFGADDPSFGCDADASPWLLRFEFDRMSMLNLKMTMLDLEAALVDHFDDTVSCILSDDNADTLVCRLRLNAIPENSDDLLTEVKALELSIMDHLVVKGVHGINKAKPSKPLTALLRYDPSSDAFVDDDEWFIETAGSNLLDVMAHPCVDHTRVETNDVYEVYVTLGIEAARQVLIDEMRVVLRDTPIDNRHLCLLADTMSNRGFFMSIDRHGINNRGELGPLAKCSFEQTTDMLIKAGIFAERDRINGVSANIVLGQVAPCGTGDCQVLMDNERLAVLAKPVVLDEAIERGRRDDSEVVPALVPSPAESIPALSFEDNADAPQTPLVPRKKAVAIRVKEVDKK